jgi:hypothetical protein
MWILPYVKAGYAEIVIELGRDKFWFKIRLVFITARASL